jgi:pimeloyl-ACP methyl ester carboxylesterase
MESHTVPVGGVPVRWEESGSGVPVVLVHGIPTSPALWRHVVPHVKGARCLAFEMAGYGQSIPAGAGRDISVAAQAGYLLDWMNQIGTEKAVLAGHDLGGGVAQIAAVRQPGRCAGLLLANAIGYDSWPVAPVRLLRRAGAFVERLPAAAMRPALASLILAGHDDMAVAAESLKVHAGPYARPGGPAGLVRQVRSLDTGDTLAVQGKLAGLRVPARVVWGAADQFQKVRYGEQFAADLGVPLQRIEGGKHFIPEDHPGAIAAALNDLVREASPGGTGAGGQSGGR